jgi:hypothetical protein
LQSSKSNKRQWFLSRGSVKHNMLAYFMLWCHNGQGLHSTPLKRSQRSTWVSRSSFIFHIPFARNLHNLELLTALQMTKITTYSNGGRYNTHARANHAHVRKPKTRVQEHNVTRTAQNLRSNLTKINRRRDRRVSECWYALEILRVLVGDAWGYFYSPRGLGVVASSIWKLQNFPVYKFTEPSGVPSDHLH